MKSTAFAQLASELFLVAPNGFRLSFEDQRGKTKTEKVIFHRKAASDLQICDFRSTVESHSQPVQAGALTRFRVCVGWLRRCTKQVIAALSFAPTPFGTERRTNIQHRHTLCDFGSLHFSLL